MKKIKPGSLVKFKSEEFNKFASFRSLEAALGRNISNDCDMFEPNTKIAYTVISSVRRSFNSLWLPDTRTKVKLRLDERDFVCLLDPTDSRVFWIRAIYFEDALDSVYT